jgi:ATP-binding cassette subfamily C protein CydD
MAVLRIAFLSSAILEFFSAVAVALVAVYVGLGLLGQIHFGPAEQISFREALFVLLLAPEFFMPLRQLAINYHDRAAALGAADAILTILERDADVFEAGNNDIGCVDEGGASIANEELRTSAPSYSDFQGNKSPIEFNNVSKFYGQRQVLTDINLCIATCYWVLRQQQKDRYTLMAYPLTVKTPLKQSLGWGKTPIFFMVV